VSITLLYWIENRVTARSVASQPVWEFEGQLAKKSVRPPAVERKARKTGRDYKHPPVDRPGSPGPPFDTQITVRNLLAALSGRYNNMGAGRLF
jgi:hypothetical protein